MVVHVRVFGFLAVAFVAWAVSPRLAGQGASGPLADVGWLAGRWELIEGSRCTEEHWTAASTNMLIGMSRAVNNGRTTSFEFMRIEARPDGVYFVAQPGGRPPVDFKLAGAVASELVFLNPGHADRLTRVVYRRQDGDTMTARIEGAEGGKPFAIDYPYRRSKDGLACGAVK